ncbi:MAG: MmcQ/YjbR family DNA-binding protein [Chloroflexota bacterium]
MSITFESFQAYCLQKKGTTAGYPFGEGVLVFKVLNKMFATCSTDEPQLNVNLKCDPDLAVTLRHHYEAIQPGYHMNKKHWNTLILDGSIPDEEVFGLVDHSYDLVAKSLKKADRAQLGF